MASPRVMGVAVGVVLLLVVVLALIGGPADDGGGFDTWGDDGA